MKFTLNFERRYQGRISSVFLEFLLHISPILSVLQIKWCNRFHNWDVGSTGILPVKKRHTFLSFNVIHSFWAKQRIQTNYYQKKHEKVHYFNYFQYRECVHVCGCVIWENLWEVGNFSFFGRTEWQCICNSDICLKYSLECLRLQRQFLPSFLAMTNCVFTNTWNSVKQSQGKQRNECLHP